jgi:signal transduction histidine kinase/ActR/RegA family two-component response regulator
MASTTPPIVTGAPRRHLAETAAPSLHRPEARPPGPRGPAWLRLLATVVLVAGFGYLRLGVYPDRFVPLASILALLVCLWHRDVRLLWAMVGAFLLMVVYKAAVLVPLDAVPGRHEWLFAAMQAMNLIAAAAVVHGVIRLLGRLEATAGSLREANAELEASNEELAAREEEVTQQNEELQSQSEELEQQTEELNSQTEELQALAEQLAERERTLAEILDTTAEGNGGEAETLRQLGESVDRLLGHRAAGAAILTPEGAEMVVRPLFGVSGNGGRVEGNRSLAALILERGRTGALPDVSLRPDLEVPALAGDEPVRSLAGAPIPLGDSEGATLEVYATEPGEWSDHELRIVEWLAEQCGRMLTIFEMRRERETLLESERAARTEAERANRAKDEFVATLSHELRTPLNAVLGWASVLRKSTESGPPDLVKGLEVIERQARHQGQLISDLLDISRTMAGKLHLEIGKVDLSVVVENALESARQAAESKELKLERDLGNVRRAVVGDPTRLEQVVWNLLSNAVKFTPPEGTIRVEVREREGDVEITVSDTGEGIDPSLLPGLFERYRQADGSSTRRHGGLGLGLAIVRNLVELHGGSVEARSEGAGKGSAFTVRLPTRAADWADAREPDAGHPGRTEEGEGPKLSGLEILVVDDDRDTRDLIARILGDGGAEVHRAASGEEAISLLDDVRPDVLISDIGMPGMDGYTFIRALRERTAEWERPLPAIALTAFARSEDRARALLAGYHSHVAKPVDSSELVAAVEDLRRALEPASDPSPDEGPSTADGDRADASSAD